MTDLKLMRLHYLGLDQSRHRQSPRRHAELAAEIQFADESGAADLAGEKPLITAQDALGFRCVFQQQLHTKRRRTFLAERVEVGRAGLRLRMKKRVAATDISLERMIQADAVAQ